MKVAIFVCMKVIGIMGAMPEEINEVVALLQDRKEEVHAMRNYYTGTLNGVNTVVVFSRWGKVAAAATATTLIHQFQITHLLFTGVAGAVKESFNIGDMVIGHRLVQHDMDARPLMPQHEIPLLGKTYFECDASLAEACLTAARHVYNNITLEKIIGNNAQDAFGISHPKVQQGDIASGDQFIATTWQRQQVTELLPSVVCVEMEGAAVAQVCYEHALPFAIMRVISDGANEQSHIDFPAFIRQVAGKIAGAVIHQLSLE